MFANWKYLEWEGVWEVRGEGCKTGCHIVPIWNVEEDIEQVGRGVGGVFVCWLVA